jgi:signal transduction histidine kinase
MLAELSRTEELRRNLVGDVAHELRTPLTNIRGYVEGISDGVMQPDAETLTSIRGEIHLLTRLIEDLQDLALVESGQMQLKVRSCDLGDLIKDASLAVHPQAQAKSISLEVDEACRLPIQADAQRVSQVLCNLLVNAITHTPTGGRVQVSVKDDGPGIAAEDQPYVFERFFRVDKSRSRATGGVGLGLTITRRLVEAHQGQIEVISQAGQGAEFRFTLPLEPVSQPA